MDLMWPVSNHPEPVLGSGDESIGMAGGTPLRGGGMISFPLLPAFLEPQPNLAFPNEFLADEIRA